MWIEVKTSSLHDALGEEDRVLEVVAVPRHERDEHVPAERQLAELGRRTVGDDVALRRRWSPTFTSGRWLMQVFWFERWNFMQPVDVDARLGRIGLLGGADDDTGGVDLVDHAGAARRDRGAGVARDHAFHAGADERRLGAHQRHGLALHVRAHQGAVGVVVLEERDQRRRDRNELLRRHVHVVDLVDAAPCSTSPAWRQTIRSSVKLAPWRRSARSPGRPCSFASSIAER